MSSNEHAKPARGVAGTGIVHEAPPVYARPGQRGYRADIDGLRTLAVIPVVFFHAGIPPFSGGFVGVDVFFVISGYLITQVILRDVDQGDFSIIRFYERRVRRILPALVAVMTACLAIAPFVFIPPDFESFSKSVVATALFVSNISFWREAGYFGASSQVKPLLHTWSLAVEEQFYVFYPLFIAAFLKWSRTSLVPAMIFGLFLSFAVSVWGVTHAATATFYLSPSRAWELLIGCFLALDIPPPLTNRVLRELTSVVGLAAIAWAVFSLSEDSFFPGANALYPCLGAALLIYSNAQSKTYVGRLLSTRAFVFIGLISYSLYLWHWPILVFANQAFGILPGSLAVAVPLALAFVAAALSWRYVEQPFRIRRTFFTRPRLFYAALAAGVIIAGAGTAGVVSDGWPGRFDPEIVKLTNYVDYADSVVWKSDVHQGSCFIELTQNGGYDFNNCFRVVAEKKNVLLWGDSLAAHYIRGLETGLRGTNVHLLEATKGACPPVANLEYIESRGCIAFNRQVQSLIGRSKVDGVILSANWVRGIDHSTDEMVRGLMKTVSMLRRNHLPVLVVGPSIEYDDRLPLIIARYRMSGENPQKLPQRFLRDESWALDGQMRNTFGFLPGVIYVSILQSMCPGHRCPLYAQDGEPMEFDTHHLTAGGSTTVAQKALISNVLDLVRERPLKKK